MGSCRLHQNVQICLGILRQKFGKLSDCLSPCLVITGQPGIGEFLLILLPLNFALLTFRVQANLFGAGTRCECAVSKKKTGHLVFEWELLVVRRVFKQPTMFEPTYYKIVSYMDTCRLGGSPIHWDYLHTERSILFYTPPLQLHQDGTKYTKP